MVSLRPLVAWISFLSDALFLLRLKLPAEAPRTYNVAVPARMVLGGVTLGHSAVVM